MNYKIVLYLFISFMVLKTGCKNNPLMPEVSLNNDFSIKYGNTVYIPEENISVTFKDVVEDSRCPYGPCNGDNTVKIQLVIRQGFESRVDTVQTRFTQSIVSIGEINNSYLFWVKGVEPSVKINENINKSDYVLDLNITHFTYGFSESEIENKTGIFGQVYINTGGPINWIGYLNEKPYEATFRVVDSKSDTTTIKTDTTGRFISSLSPGEYHLIRSRGFPWLIDTTSFSLIQGSMKFINVYYAVPIAEANKNNL